MAKEEKIKCGGLDIFVQREELGDRKWHEEPMEGP